MIYLASPYAHPDPAKRQARYQAALHATHLLLLQNKWTYCPVVYCHQIALAYTLPTDVAFWRDFNQHMMRRALHMKVLQIDGWKESEGIQEEIAYAAELGLTWSYM